MTVFGFDLRYQVRGQDDELAMQKLGTALERAGHSFDNFGRRYWPRLTPLLEEEIRGQFGAQGRGPHRGGWKPLSPAYAAQKAKLYPGRPILQRTGAMFAALTSSGAPGALRTPSGGDEFQFGTSGVEYASFHQTSTSRMPDRPIFDFTPTLEREMTAEARDLARDLMREADLDRYGSIPR